MHPAFLNPVAKAGPYPCLETKLYPKPPTLRNLKNPSRAYEKVTTPPPPKRLNDYSTVYKPASVYDTLSKPLSWRVRAVIIRREGCKTSLA